MGKHICGRGDSIPSIAMAYGFFWETIWDHGENADLKAKRKDPNVLFPGDEVFVPEKRRKDVTRPNEARHSFVRKGEPHKLKLTLKSMGQARANEDYVLVVGRERFSGKTDAEGKIEHVIPGDASTGTLILRGGKERHTVSVGRLDPDSEVSGIQQRLSNLGFPCGRDRGEMNDATQQALKEFQAKHDLKVTGEIDGATKGKLREFYP